MNRHEEGALGDPVLAGNPVYDLDGRSCSQTSGRCVGSSGYGHVTSTKDASQTGWAHSVIKASAAHRVKL
jgi:hypothetical protein